MRKSNIYLFIVAVSFVIVAVVASGTVVGLAQNSNSSTTMANTNAGTKKKPRHRAKPKTGEAETASSETKATPPKTGRCDPMKEEQTDLSGTYTGKANHGNGQPPQDATLTITGNNFTMNSGSETHSGRITAVTTCGYTAVTMMIGDLTPPAPSPNPPAALPALSLRAKKVGDKLWLTSVPGEKMQVSFTPSRGGAMKKPRHKMSKKPVTPPPPTKTTP